MQLRLLALVAVLLAGTAARATAQQPETLPPGAIQGNPAVPFSPFGRYAGDQGGQFFEVTPVEAVENRYTGLPVPVDCPLNAPGWQEPHYVYHPGACDYSPPCTDHLWAHYCQIPCRCKPYCHTPHQRTGFRPCHHGQCGRHGCGSFGTCGLYQQPGGCGDDCHGFRLHPCKKSCCDCDCCGDSLTGCPSCTGGAAHCPAPSPAAESAPLPPAAQAHGAPRPKIVTTKPALLAPPVIADPLPAQSASNTPRPLIAAQPVGASVAPAQPPVLHDSGLSSVGPRAVRSTAAGSYYAK